MGGEIVISGQHLAWSDLWVVGLLVVLEGVLSIDNALVLGLLAKRLPPRQRPRALTYGLFGAFVFRILAIGTASFLLQWTVVKLLGGGYLVYIAVKHLFFESQEEHGGSVVEGPEGDPALVDAATGRELSPEQELLELEERVPVPLPDDVAHPVPETRASVLAFWKTVFVIELTDIAFAVDSILAAIALVGSKPKHLPDEVAHPKLWVVVTGGMLGVALMRFAAVLFIRLLEKFPRFETAAYLLVTVIGGKLLVDWGLNSPDPDVPHAVDFHDPKHAAFWIFWVLMVVCFCVGFIRPKSAPAAPETGESR
jgi:YkoY family integral membrane protein